MSQPNIVASLKLPAFIVVVENVFSELFETKLQKRILNCRIATQCADSLAFKIHFELQQHQKSLWKTLKELAITDSTFKALFSNSS